MKKFLFVILMVVILGKETSSEPPKRFEMIYNEYPHNSQSVIRRFETWHDKETGVEFICVIPVTTLESADKISCFPTGRNWK